MYVDINYKGELLSVEGNYIKGEPQTYNHPGVPDDFEIEHIWYKEVDIFCFIENLYEVERLVLEMDPFLMIP